MKNILWLIAGVLIGALSLFFKKDRGELDRISAESLGHIMRAEGRRGF